MVPTKKEVSTMSERRIAPGMRKSRAIAAMTREDTQDLPNLGARLVLNDLLVKGRVIDPTDQSQGFELIEQLDILGIYGQQISFLFYVVCVHDLTRFAALLRASELEDVLEVNGTSINAAIENGKELGGFDFDKIVAAVRRRRPAFGCVAA